MLKHLAAAATLAFCALCTAQPLTTAFTFQGELNNGAAVANGTYDFRFALFDSPLGGVQVGLQLCSDDIAVVNGKITVQLDFGAQFAGQQRFLEVQVRQDTGLPCSNPSGFTILGPRQSLSATPNAVYSLTAASAATATNTTQLNGQPAAYYTNANNLTGTLPPAALSGTYSSALTLSNVNNIFAGSGAGITSLNATSLATGTLDPARLPVPLTLTGNAPISILGASNASTSSSTAALLGRTTSSTGFTNGVLGQSDSTGGNGIYGIASATSGQAWGVYGITNSVDGLGGYFTGPGDGLWGVTNGLGKSGALGFNFSGGDGVGVYGQTNGTTGAGVFGRVYTTTGATSGGLFVDYSTSGKGAAGYAYATSGDAVGLYGETASINGAAVRGLATGSSTTNQSYGGSFIALSANGIGVYASGNTDGVYAISPAPNGIGVTGYADASSTQTVGVLGSAFSFSGIGVKGIVSSTSGPTYGGFFQCSSPIGYGLYSVNTASTGAALGILGQSASTGGIGVKGLATSTSGQTYGVLGQASPNGWAIYSQGDFGSSGLKSFRIDHPQDPENKYLLHYCAEGPDPLNVYTGKATLNQQGDATIDLPPYFASINKDPRYTLTPIGAPMPLLHIAQEIDEALLTQAAAAAPSDPIPAVSFTIAGGAPNSKVSWRVEALRNDKYVQQHGTPVIVDKQGAEKGTYQHPDLYNQPLEKGMDYKETSRNTPDVPRPSTPDAPTPSHT